MNQGSSPAPTAPPQFSPDGKWWWNGQEWVAAATPRLAPPKPGVCRVCGATPAQQVFFRQHIGIVLVWINRRYGGWLCRTCATGLFRRTMSNTLLTGWWGLLSAFLINPITIVYNLVERFRVSRMTEPVLGDPTRKPMDPGRPVFLRPG